MTRLLGVWFLALASALPASAQCVNGQIDHRAYFYQVIGRMEGQLAGDWAAVLASSGIPRGLPPGVRPNPGDHWGLTQQVGAVGDVRGRIFLPTSTPDELGYYSHPVDVVPGYPEHPTWGWIDRGGPPVAFVPCGSAPIPTPVPVPTPVPQPVPVDNAPILTAIANLSKEIELFWTDNAAEHKALGEKIDSPGWFEKVMKHPITIAIESFIGGYLANLKWGN